jgi:hypothetical protein
VFDGAGVVVKNGLDAELDLKMPAPEADGDARRGEPLSRDAPPQAEGGHEAVAALFTTTYAFLKVPASLRPASGR